MGELNPGELSDTEQETLKKIIENLQRQPEQRFTAQLIVDPATGEANILESRQSGDNPPETKIIKEKS